MYTNTSGPVYLCSAIVQYFWYHGNLLAIVISLDIFFHLLCVIYRAPHIIMADRKTRNAANIQQMVDTVSNFAISRQVQFTRSYVDRFVMHILDDQAHQNFANFLIVFHRWTLGKQTRAFFCSAGLLIG